MTVTCPTCKKLTEYSEKNIYRPFCSDRCKLIDLGEWASGKYALPVDQSENDDSEDHVELPGDED